MLGVTEAATFIAKSLLKKCSRNVQVRIETGQ